MDPSSPRANDPDLPLRRRAVIGTGLFFTVLAVVVAFYLVMARDVGLGAALGVVVLGAATGAGAGTLVYHGSGMAAGGLVQVITGAGNLRPAPSFSFQESLIVRGRHAEAAASFREHLAANPGDHDARLALADLLSGPLKDELGAERVYQEVRKGQPTARQERQASEGLIALYARTKQAGKQMAELARFADRYPGTEAAAAARRTLAELKKS